MRLIKALIYLDTLTDKQTKFILRYFKTKDYVVLPSDHKDIRTARKLARFGYATICPLRDGLRFSLKYVESDREELATWKQDAYATPEDCEMDWIRYDRRNAGDTSCVFPANMLPVSLRS
jgi:hypothetical protein